MRDVSFTAYRPEITSTTTGWVSRRVESPSTERAYQMLNDQARRTAAILIKDGARKYVLRPGMLDNIEIGLAKQTPRTMDARLHTIWAERRVQPINYKSALLYARLLRARDSYYLAHKRAS